MSTVASTVESVAPAAPAVNLWPGTTLRGTPLQRLHPHHLDSGRCSLLPILHPNWSFCLARRASLAWTAIIRLRTRYVKVASLLSVQSPILEAVTETIVAYNTDLPTVSNVSPPTAQDKLHGKRSTPQRDFPVAKQCTSPSSGHASLTARDEAASRGAGRIS